jgi:hypothetical protein
VLLFTYRTTRTYLVRFLHCCRYRCISLLQMSGCIAQPREACRGRHQMETCGPRCSYVLNCDSKHRNAASNSINFLHRQPRIRWEQYIVTWTLCLPGPHPHQRDKCRPHCYVPVEPTTSRRSFGALFQRELHGGLMYAALPALPLPCDLFHEVLDRCLSVLAVHCFPGCV